MVPRAVFVQFMEFMGLNEDQIFAESVKKVVNVERRWIENEEEFQDKPGVVYQN